MLDPVIMTVPADRWKSLGTACSSGSRRETMSLASISGDIFSRIFGKVMVSLVCPMVARERRTSNSAHASSHSLRCFAELSCQRRYWETQWKSQSRKRLEKNRKNMFFRMLTMSASLAMRRRVAAAFAPCSSWLRRFLKCGAWRSDFSKSEKIAS